MYTLSDVAKKTGISMPTLQRYKKAYQGRIPATGKGRKQRYPEDALPVFLQIKQENASRRGRPRKNASGAAAPARMRRGPGRPPGRRGPGRPPGSAAGGRRPGRRPGRPPGRTGPGRPPGSGRAMGGEGLLTLTSISAQTGISYPTLVRYVRLYGNRLPSVGTGRKRRFRPEAVDVFRQLRSQSGRGGRKPGPRPGARRGRPPGGGGGGDAQLASRLRELERGQAALTRRVERLVNGLQKAFSR